MQALLSLDQSPPLAAPLRFFLTAPCFGALAGLLVLVAGPEVFASRWMPASLAATHLLTLGFMLSCMLGALIQVLPVVAGANLAQPLRVARLVHVLLSLGSVLLALAFLTHKTLLFSAAGLALLLGIGYFLGAAGRALLGIASTSPTISGLKLAWLGLLVTVVLGLALAGSLAGLWPLPWPGVTDLHAGWGLAGWSGILLAAMAYVVVPMFQLTPGYPARESRYGPPVVFALLGLWTVIIAFSMNEAVRLAEAGLAVLGMFFAGRTIRLQRQRRRPRRDALAAYWQSGMACAALAGLMLLVAAIVPEWASARAWPLVFGILLIVGGFMNFIIGMLYKIIPFLSWLHLQQAGAGPALAMGKLLPDAPALRQWQVQQLALALLLLAALWPEWLARPAGGMLVLAQAMLFYNLAGALRRYRQQRQAIGAKPGNAAGSTPDSAAASTPGAAPATQTVTPAGGISA